MARADRLRAAALAGAPRSSSASSPSHKSAASSSGRPNASADRGATPPCGARVGRPRRGNDGAGATVRPCSVVNVPMQFDGVAGRGGSMRVERALQRRHRLLAGMDEVGRGALAGPVSVGVVFIDETCRIAPAGRQGLQAAHARGRERDGAARSADGPSRYAVGHAAPPRSTTSASSPPCGSRAAARSPRRRRARPRDPRRQPRLAHRARRGGAVRLRRRRRAGDPPVTTMIKADLKCSSVAAASVLAKVERDGLMVASAPSHPAYGWARTRGTPRRSTWRRSRRTGRATLHRRSWRLPGVHRAGLEAVMMARRRARGHRGEQTGMSDQR